MLAQKLRKALKKYGGFNYETEIQNKYTDEELEFIWKEYKKLVAFDDESESIGSLSRDLSIKMRSMELIKNNITGKSPLQIAQVLRCFKNSFYEIKKILGENKKNVITKSYLKQLIKEQIKNIKSY